MYYFIVNPNSRSGARTKGMGSFEKGIGIATDRLYGLHDQICRSRCTAF